MVELRPYQAKAVRAARLEWANGRRSILIVAPTGAGKTVIGSTIARSSQERTGGMSIWVAHREELLGQALAAMESIGVRARISDGDWRDGFVNIVTIQTLCSRGAPKSSFVIADEAHHFAAAEWSRPILGFVASGATVIGLTATPARGDGIGLRAVFDAMVPVAQPRELIDMGFLVPCRVRMPAQQTRHLAEDPVKLCVPGKKSIVFCSSVAAARLAADKLGQRAACVDGEMHARDRTAAIEAFRNGTLDVLTNVFVLGEGFDVPSVDNVVLAKRFSSKTSYMQAVGRGMRPFAGKRFCDVWDLRGSCHEHGLPEQDRDYSLDGEAYKEPSEGYLVKECVRCGWVAQPWAGSCPDCGYTAPPVIPKVKRAPLSEMFKADDSSVRADYLARMERIAKTTGRKQGWALYKYKSKYGAFPTSEVRLESRNH